MIFLLFLLIYLLPFCMASEAVTESPSATATAVPDAAMKHLYVDNPTSHTDSRFKTDVLALTADLTTVGRMLYSIFERGICKFNEQYDLDTKSCRCFKGYEGEDCDVPVKPCGAAIPACQNDGLCVDGICVCSSDWAGADCATPARCDVMKPCQYPRFQRCLPSANTLLCEDSLPLRLQYFVGQNCSDNDECNINEECQNHWCVCKRGTVKTDVKPAAICEPGLFTCYNQEDCSAIADDLVCRHDTYKLSNKFRYTGKGPYCVCFNEEKIDSKTGLCITKSFVFADPKHPRKVNFGENFWPIFAAVGVVGALIGFVVYKLKFASNSPDQNAHLYGLVTKIPLVENLNRERFQSQQEIDRRGSVALETKKTKIRSSLYKVEEMADEALDTFLEKSGGLKPPGLDPVNSAKHLSRQGGRRSSVENQGLPPESVYYLARPPSVPAITLETPAQSAHDMHANMTPNRQRRHSANIEELSSHVPKMYTAQDISTFKK